LGVGREVKKGEDGTGRTFKKKDVGGLSEATGGVSW